MKWVPKSHLAAANAQTQMHTHSAWAGQLFWIWEVFELINNERRYDGKWKTELERVSGRDWREMVSGWKWERQWRALPRELFPIQRSYNGVRLAHFPKKHLRGKIICSIINRRTEKCSRWFCDLAHIYCNSGQMDSEVTGTRRKRGGLGETNGCRKTKHSKEVRRKVVGCWTLKYLVYM